MVVSIIFFACSSNHLPTIYCAGSVKFLNYGLGEVIIKTNTKGYATTNDMGQFQFSTESTALEIFPQKNGFIFEPKSVKIKPGENNVNFVAHEIAPLMGKLQLDKIEITPISIVYGKDNYTYINNNKPALKASDIAILINNYKVQALSNPMYLYKEEINELEILDKYVIDCRKLNSLGILINAYFINNQQEVNTTDSEFIDLKITIPPTNKDLQQGDGKIIYYLSHVNNKGRAFTFSVAFEFNYTT